MAICIAEYKATGSQVQLALERGLPAMIGNFISKQLPYPSLSFDMIHCAQCGVVWDEKGTHKNPILPSCFMFYIIFSGDSYCDQCCRWNLALRS